MALQANSTTITSVSLVIGTRNRADQLARTLDWVSKLECSLPWELVLVDNASTDHTSTVCSDFQKRGIVSCKIIHESRLGSSNARNAGARASTGDIIVSIDDDCYPDGNFLFDVVQSFTENPGLGALGGRILLFDPNDQPITIQTQLVPEEVEPWGIVRAGLIQGANMALLRTAFEQAGGYDPRFGAGTEFSCEEVDLLAAISANGWMIRYDPRPLVFHHHGRRSVTEANALMKTYDIGRGAFYFKQCLNGRFRYLAYWLRAVRYQKIGVTLREIAGAGLLLYRMVQRIIVGETELAN